MTCSIGRWSRRLWISATTKKYATASVRHSAHTHEWKYNKLNLASEWVLQWVYALPISPSLCCFLFVRWWNMFMHCSFGQQSGQLSLFRRLQFIIQLMLIFSLTNISVCHSLPPQISCISQWKCHRQRERVRIGAAVEWNKDLFHSLRYDNKINNSQRIL